MGNPSILPACHAWLEQLRWPNLDWLEITSLILDAIFHSTILHIINHQRGACICFLKSPFSCGIKNSSYKIRSKSIYRCIICTCDFSPLDDFSVRFMVSEKWPSPWTTSTKKFDQKIPTQSKVMAVWNHGTSSAIYFLSAGEIKENLTWPPNNFTVVQFKEPARQRNPKVRFILGQT